MIRLLILIITLNMFLFSMDINEKDKQKHILATTIISLSVDQILTEEKYFDNKYNRLLTSFAITNSIGVLKEIMDDREKNNKFDKEDIVANMIGTTIGLISSEFINGFKVVPKKDKVYISKEFKF